MRKAPTKYLILEKLLFNKKRDYDVASKLIKSKEAMAWVNCSMRTMPFYQKLKEILKSGPIYYQVSGSQFGLVTNAIHYIDHIAHYSGETSYRINPSGLASKPIKSKRRGFLELTGTLMVHFKDGSQGVFVCHAEGDMPVVVEIQSNSMRIISRESEGKVWISSEKSSWSWEEQEARVPYQSEMTKAVVEEVLLKGTCPLTTLDESIILHRPLLEGLNEFLNRQGESYSLYPFT